MRDKLIIIGAGGHGKMCASVALKLNQWRQIFFLDDFKDSKALGLEVIKPITLETHIDSGTDFFVGIGDNEIRKRYIEQLIAMDASVVTLVDPSAVVSKHSKIDEGVIVMPGAIINAGTRIEKASIINTGTIIDHNGHIGSFSHLAPRVSIAGNVSIGAHCMVGIGSTIINNIQITDHTVIGAQSLILKNIDTPGTYFGSSAQLRSKR